jgi:hypothetical protein
MATSFENLVAVLTPSKELFWHENANLPEAEIQRLWHLRWTCLTSNVVGNSERPKSEAAPILPTLFKESSSSSSADSVIGLTRRFEANTSADLEFGSTVSIEANFLSSNREPWTSLNEGIDLGPPVVKHEGYMPKHVNFTSGDVNTQQKAKIPQIDRPQPQRKTTFCSMCADHPQGFHGDHELRRHIDRHHTTIRKVWICRDAINEETRPVVPLANCKACRNSKTYGANYNAAAHLRRAHFYPSKNMRGGRGKEERGGMGGGEHPPMEELKNWISEKWQSIINGQVTLQDPAPVDDFSYSEADANPINRHLEIDETADYSNLPVDVSQDSGAVI